VDVCQKGKMKVNRSTISRCFKKYREEGFLEDKGFTRKGKEFLEYYKMIEADLYHYFASIGINEEQQRQAVTGMFDTADIDTIQKLCQKEKMHLSSRKRLAESFDGRSGF
jgi:Mn-dependent DtxR family transcriptional regulator